MPREILLCVAHTSCIDLFNLTYAFTFNPLQAIAINPVRTKMKAMSQFSQTSNMILINATLLLIHFLLCLNLCLCFMSTCMYCLNCFFIDNVVRAAFLRNMCACHEYFTINLLTYLLVGSKDRVERDQRSDGHDRLLYVTG